MENDDIFPEPDALAKVAEFHSAFELPVKRSPGIPAEGRAEMRLALLEEELQELRAAIERKDLVAVADAFSDLQYVLSGAVHEFGMGEIMKACFDEVHRSNMSKCCANKREAELTLDSYREKGVLAGKIRKNEFGWVVYREDGKVLKSIAYNPPDLSSIVHKKS